MPVSVCGKGRQYNKSFNPVYLPQVESWVEMSMVSCSNVLSGLVRVPWLSNLSYPPTRNTGMTWLLNFITHGECFMLLLSGTYGVIQLLHVHCSLSVFSSIYMYMTVHVYSSICRSHMYMYIVLHM